MYKFKKNKFIILIPVYNELKNLRLFIKKVNKLCEVVILDDCSTDGTVQWLKKNKIRFLRNKKNIGYERNLLKGIKKFKRLYQYLITFDGDGQHKIFDLKKIMKVKEDFDVIVCNRLKKNRLLEIIISQVSEFFFSVKDPLSGFKVYNSRIIKNKNFKNIGNFFLVDFLLSFLEKNSKIKNITINVNKRLDKPRVGGFIKVNFKELRILVLVILKKIKLVSNFQ